MVGERISLAIDPKHRHRASVTCSGSQASFLNTGDMYAMAAEYASYLTGGALQFIRKNGHPAPVPCVWNPKRWLADAAKDEL